MHSFLSIHPLLSGEGILPSPHLRWKTSWYIIVAEINEVIMIPTCSHTRSRDRCTRKDLDKWHWHTVYSTDNSFPGFAPSLLDPIEFRSWRVVTEDVFLPILCRPNNLRCLLKIITLNYSQILLIKNSRFKRFKKLYKILMKANPISSSFKWRNYH